MTNSAIHRQTGLTVSVIIPTYNRLPLLQRALDSVFQQTHAPEEIIVIDDGSTDGSAAYIRAYYPFVTVIEQANTGVSAARNAGINAARGEWIALLDSDDEWHAEKLEKQLLTLKQNPEYLFCHTEEIWIRHGKRVNQMHKHRKAGGWIFNQCLPLCIISPSSSLIHRSLFAQVGMFDESLPACEDYDLWLKICARYPVLFIEQPLITKYGGHADQLSHKHWGMDRFRINVLHRLICSGVLNEQQEIAAQTELKRKLHIFIKGAVKHGNYEYQQRFERMLAQYEATAIA